MDTLKAIIYHIVKTLGRVDGRTRPKALLRWFRSDLPPSLVTDIRDNTWTPDGMRQACKKYVAAALRSVRALLR